MELNRELHEFRDSSRVAILSLDNPECNSSSSGPGRPKYLLDEEKLIYFRDLGFNWKTIAAMLMVSRWTIHRRIAELGLKEV